MLNPNKAIELGNEIDQLRAELASAQEEIALQVIECDELKFVIQKRNEELAVARDLSKCNDSALKDRIADLENELAEQRRLNRLCSERESDVLEELAALRQQTGEPVAWYIPEKDLSTTDTQWAKENEDMCEPLYLAQPAAVPAWQPIETVPKDETFLAVLECGGEQTICTMRWPVAERKNSLPNGRDFIRERVTHWMPLPTAPETEK